MKKIERLMSLLDATNVAKKVSEEQLTKIANDVISGYKIDRASRKEWEQRCEEAIKFAKQIQKPKDFPWENPSNVIFPLLTVSSNVFAARTYPEIIKDRKVVKTAVIGSDPVGEKQRKANKVSNHMSYQRLIESDTWEPDTDKLLHILPLIGVCFRKVYYDPLDDISQADLCSPDDIVVNHDVPSLAKAYRVTHRYFLNKNAIIEKLRSGYFIGKEKDIEQQANTFPEEDVWQTSLDDNREIATDQDSQIKVEFLEQHTFIDLDGDGYEEPWIVVVDKNNVKTVGIYPRFDVNAIRVDGAGNILKITPTQYFVDYHFMPSPDGGFYSLGYGHVLYPLNEAINTLINQNIDAGTLSTTNCGLISRALKIKGGSLKMKMGQYDPVDPGSTGKIADSIYQFQFPGPSPVLANLLSLLVDSAKEIASINDVLTGGANPQNSPASSVFELANQGMKLFNSIAKRLYRSLKKEFKLLFELNAKYLDQGKYFLYGDDQTYIVKDDYDVDAIDIVPIADPNLGSSIQRSMQANAINMLLQNQAILPELKVNNIVREFFESLKIPDDKIDQFVFSPQEKQQMQQNQPPNLDQQKLQLEMQKMQKDFEVKMAQNEKANRELELKYLDLMKKYQLKEAETDEKQARMMADADYKKAQADTMAEKLDIERDKVAAMREKIRKE